MAALAFQPSGSGTPDAGLKARQRANDDKHWHRGTASGPARGRAAGPRCASSLPSPFRRSAAAPCATQGLVTELGFKNTSKGTRRGPALTVTPFLPGKRHGALKAKREQGAGRDLPSRCWGSPGLPSAAPAPRAAAPSRRRPLPLGRHKSSRSLPAPGSCRTRGRGGWGEPCAGCRGNRRIPPNQAIKPLHPFSLPPSLLGVSCSQKHMCRVGGGRRNPPRAGHPALTGRPQQQREGDAAEQPPAPHSSGQHTAPSRLLAVYKTARRYFLLPPPARDPLLQPPAWGRGGGVSSSSSSIPRWAAPRRCPSSATEALPWVWGCETGLSHRHPKHLHRGSL